MSRLLHSAAVSFTSLLSLHASKRERSKQSRSRSFARSKTRKQSCLRSGSFSRPTKIQQSRPTLIQKKGEGFGNKQTAFYHSCKGSKPPLLKYQRLLSIGFIRSLQAISAERCLRLKVDLSYFRSISKAGFR